MACKWISKMHSIKKTLNQPDITHFSPSTITLAVWETCPTIFRSVQEYTPPSVPLVEWIVRLDSVMWILSDGVTICPSFDHVTVGKGFPDASQTRFSGASSLVSMELGDTFKSLGNAEINRQVETSAYLHNSPNSHRRCPWVHRSLEYNTNSTVGCRPFLIIAQIL